MSCSCCCCCCCFPCLCCCLSSAFSLDALLLCFETSPREGTAVSLLSGLKGRFFLSRRFLSFAFVSFSEDDLTLTLDPISFRFGLGLGLDSGFGASNPAAMSQFSSFLVVWPYYRQFYVCWVAARSFGFEDAAGALGFIFFRLTFLSSLIFDVDIQPLPRWTAQKSLCPSRGGHICRHRFDGSPTLDRLRLRCFNRLLIALAFALFPATVCFVCFIPFGRSASSLPFTVYLAPSWRGVDPRSEWHFFLYFLNRALTHSTNSLTQSLICRRQIASLFQFPNNMGTFGARLCTFSNFFLALRFFPLPALFCSLPVLFSLLREPLVHWLFAISGRAVPTATEHVQFVITIVNLLVIMV